MTLDQWTAIAEILSPIVIAVTLLCLVIQTRQNASAIQANTRHAMYVKYKYFDSGFVDEVSDRISSTPINTQTKPTMAIAAELRD